jgi:hypothetical protein
VREPMAAARTHDEFDGKKEGFADATPNLELILLGAFGPLKT